ncbi:MAG: hypothetical protein NTV34_10145 [Proteobacteria bacterium]|nr:hypothetical protein [Pseudomonadota bacterium]
MRILVSVFLILSYSAAASGQAWEVAVVSQTSGHVQNEELITNYLKEYNSSEMRQKCHSGNGSLRNVDHEVIIEFFGQQILVKIESSGLCVPNGYVEDVSIDECGLSGDFPERMKNCVLVNGLDATIEVGGFRWSLMAATSSGEMIWLDQLERTLWTSPLEGIYQTGVGHSPCKKAGDLYGLQNIALSVPALDQFKAAWHHAAQEILPFGRDWHWTSTFQGDIQAYAYNGFSRRGSLTPVDRYFRVRCVATLG